MNALPSEIITHLLEYLSFEDRQQMRMINKTWYYASLHPKLLKKEQFNYSDNIFHEIGDSKTQTHKKMFNKFKKVLLKSNRKLFNINLNGLNILDDITIIENVGSRIVSLCLVHIYWLKDSFLDSITNCCDSLEILELICVENCSFSVKPRKPLLNLSFITFNRVGLSDWEFNIIMQCAPNVKDVGINYCDVLEWPQAIRRFYPNYKNSKVLTNYNSTDVFTGACIIQFLKTAKYINNLRLQRCCNIFIQLPEQIKLNSLILDGTYAMYFSREKSINIKKLNLILSEQTSLEHLKINAFPCYLLLAVSKLYNLKHLKVYFTTEFKFDCNPEICMNIFIKSLSNMKDLKTLSVAPWDEDQLQLSLPIPDNTLKHLTSLDCLIDDGNKIVMLAKNLLSLRIRNGNILSAKHLCLLFKNLTKLRHLWIDNCIELNDDILMDSPISNLKGLIALRISNAKLSYRCLKSINFLDLKSLYIDEMSLGSCIKMKDFSDFEESLKKFGASVPALTQFEIYIQSEEVLLIKELELKSFNCGPKFDMLPYFKKLKYFRLQ